MGSNEELVAAAPQDMLQNRAVEGNYLQIIKELQRDVEALKRQVQDLATRVKALGG